MKRLPYIRKAANLVTSNEARECSCDVYNRRCEELDAKNASYWFLPDAELKEMKADLPNVMARERLSSHIVATLRIQSFPLAVRYVDSRWISDKFCDYADIQHAKAIRWQNDKGKRMLVYDATIPGYATNISMAVFNGFSRELDSKKFASILADKKNYVVMGELKGGIDPAGADEHWKTARAALDRIRSTFKKVYVTFVGGAIEKSMADEIFTQLQNGQLDYAANLTNDNQLLAFCDWLVNQ